MPKAPEVAFLATSNSQTIFYQNHLSLTTARTQSSKTNSTPLKTRTPIAPKSGVTFTRRTVKLNFVNYLKTMTIRFVIKRMTTVAIFYSCFWICREMDTWCRTGSIWTDLRGSPGILGLLRTGQGFVTTPWRLIVIPVWIPTRVKVMIVWIRTSVRRTLIVGIQSGFQECHIQSLKLSRPVSAKDLLSWKLHFGCFRDIFANPPCTVWVLWISG